MPVKSYYAAAVSEFLNESPEQILGILTAAHQHALEEPQRWAWLEQISVLKSTLVDHRSGRIFLEFYIPRMGKRADAVLLLKDAVLVLEFKVGAREHTSSALDQVEDYALDIKNFHEGSHTVAIVPVLISTHAANAPISTFDFRKDLVARPIATNMIGLSDVISGLETCTKLPDLDVADWISKGYRPTPTIIEAAQALYRSHNVSEISRSDAGAINLQQTSASVNTVIQRARDAKAKTICFVTGVPGSGKTLAGLNIATQRSEVHEDEHAVFLSGNGPLVAVLREALVRDKMARDAVSRKAAEREVASFVQNIHHFRDQYLASAEVPVEHVVIFDEAQRAWTREQASKFMQRKRAQADFNMSEPEFLLSVMDRHPEWCTVVCLIGGGQEINTGEAGMSEWMDALKSRFPAWQVYVSPRVSLPEYGSTSEVAHFLDSPRVHTDEHLHLSVSIRSFRAESLSEWVSHVLDGRADAARLAHAKIQAHYPIFLTRELRLAREWLRSRARGTERSGLIASSGALRLRPDGIHIKAEIDPANWFLNPPKDVRSSNYLEDVATEFAVQGLEVDWAGVCWDGDLHYTQGGWKHQTFKGTKWQSVHDGAKRGYLKNAYRVILTRARQGMVLFVPEVDGSDWTRPASVYNETFEYLRSCGPTVLS